MIMTEEGFWWRGGDCVEVERVLPGGTAYFPAKVVNAPSVRKNLVWVEHESLYVGEGGSIRMKEYVNPTRLRPSPPREVNLRFEAGEEVDVFLKSEGFWVRGNVKEVLEKSRYVVEFKGGDFKETEVDGLKNLRLHREWVDGNWVPCLVSKATKPKIKFKRRDLYEKDPYKEECCKPLPSKKLKSCEGEEKKVFEEGMMVEVRSDEPGYEGSWYTAKIISYLGKDRYMVEYETLRTEDYRELLKEEAKGSDLRPNPPQLVQRSSTCRYELHEHVDAWYNDGWWSGQIYKIDTRYGVYFKTTDERLEFGYNDLRPCLVWIKGKWSRAKKREDEEDD